MIKILANDGLHPDGQSKLEAAGFQVDSDKIAQDDLATGLQSYEVIIVRSATKVRKEAIDANPQLKIIARAGVGLDNIDVEYARSKGVHVINTPAASSRSVAELTFAHIFSLSRSLYDSNRQMPSHGQEAFKKLKKTYAKGFEIQGKTLGILGFGRIGQQVAQMALALGMKVLAADRNNKTRTLHLSLFDDDKTSLSVKLSTVSVDEMLANSDFVTVHVPGSEQVIGAAEISKMQAGSYLLNISRGGLIDESALHAALESGHLAGAALDTFVGEPEPNILLLQHPRISLSPHIGGSTVQAQSNIGVELADQIIDILHV